MFFNFLSVMKTLLYFKNRIQTAVKPINVGLTAVFIFLTVKDGILKVDLYGTAVLLEEVGKVIAEGGCGVTISSQSGWRRS